jgi:hypothetical protein
VTRFDDVYFAYEYDGYLVKRGERFWIVPMKMIRALKDPDFLPALQAAAEVAKIEKKE